MSSTRRFPPEMDREAAEIIRIGNRAIRKAIAKSRRLKVPVVFCYNDTIYYELPDGTLTTEDPFVEDRTL